MNKFELRHWAIGFEVPFFDQEDNTGLQELSANLVSKYKNWEDTLKTELDVIQLPNRNNMVLYTIVIRVDLDLINIDTFETEWDQMKQGMTEDLEQFLKLRKLEYRVIS